VLRNHQNQVTSRILGLPRLLLSLPLLLVLVAPAYSGVAKRSREELPPELRASDPEIKQLLDSAKDRADLGDLDTALQGWLYPRGK
jgi:hypothetical protein